MLNESNKATINSLAEKWNVKPDIHPDDFIFRFLYDNPTFSSKDDAIQYYFNDGQNSAQQLSKILLDVCKYDGKKEISLLEFASGYGCVTRHMKNVLPFAHVTACDIHVEATNFIKNILNVDTVTSKSIPEELIPAEKFDVVFALSFFSHMPKTSFGRWLNQLASFVRPGGYVIFTTHGLKSQAMLPDAQFDETGFWFRPASEQKDLDTAEYGLTCTHPKFVFSTLFREPQNTLSYYHEAYWWGHQDVYVIKHNDAITNEKLKRVTQQTSSLAGKIKGSPLLRKIWRAMGSPFASQLRNYLNRK